MKFLVTRTLPGIGTCEIIMEVYQEDERLICAVFQLNGHIAAPPKAWLRLIRSELQILESVARETGCAEMRMAGRFKKNMLPDYEEYRPLSGDYGLRKAL